MDMNYLRQGCLEDAERSLRGLEQLQCLKLLCSVTQAPSRKRRQNGKIQHVAFGSKVPFLGAAIPYDTQPYLAFLFKAKEKLSMKVACLGYSVRSLVQQQQKNHDDFEGSGLPRGG